MKSAAITPDVHPVDEVLPPWRLLALGLQHVLVMYAGAIAVPLIVGGALKLPKDQIAMLINADLFACGVVTLIQAVGVWRFGIRLPVMMGVTFAAVGPMVAMAANPSLGLLGIYGAVIGSGIFAILAAPLVGRLLPLFPPVVTGSVIAIIGVSLMRVGVGWAGGGVGNPRFGDPAFLESAGLTSPYPQLWSLPVRVLDPHLEEFTAVITGPDLPTWAVVDGSSLDTWGVDASGAQPAFDREYRLVDVEGDYQVFRVRRPLGSG